MKGPPKEALLAAVMGGLFFAIPARAINLDEFERHDYDLTSSSRAWSLGPASRLRLFLDIYNVTDFYDFESNDTPGFVDGTWLADTVRPTATILWDERYRIQLGAVARRGYGEKKGFGSVDPWMQLLWQPAKPFSVILGNLDIPHYYLPAILLPLNYVRDQATETGVQLLHRRENWYDDLYFNYRLQDTPEHNEKFDLGFVHRNFLWEFLRLDYQSHWIHEGGTLNPHPFDTLNDIASAAGVGAQLHPLPFCIIGARWAYLHSHRRVDSSNPALVEHVNGDGHYYEAFTRINRFKFGYAYWRSHRYSHEGGDPWFTLGRLQLVTARWDVILGRDFNVFLGYTGYFPGNDNPGISRLLMSAIHLQVAWQFSIPIHEWNTPAAAPEGQPIPARWDEGL